MTSPTQSFRAQNTLLDIDDLEADLVPDSKSLGRLAQDLPDIRDIPVEPQTRTQSWASYTSPDSCDLCLEKHLDLHYCNVCDSTFCDKCWKTQLPHRRGALAFGSIPHEKTDVVAARRIKVALEDRNDDERQADEHARDHSTMWFGITWGDEEFPLFCDYGRFSTLMTETRVTAAGYDNKLQQDDRNPSLVSFVGETGMPNLNSGTERPFYLCTAIA